MINMMKDNISDKEIRVLGNQDSQNTSPKEQESQKESSPEGGSGKKLARTIILAAVAVCALLACLYLLSHMFILRSPSEELNYKVSYSDAISSEETVEERTIGNAFVTVKDTVINDIPLRIFTPSGSKMELFMGGLPLKDKNIVLAVQAADIRGDMDVPAGAFVYKGKIIAKGHSKYGFCAIINDQVTIGRQRETPLFERAVEENGSFFRQYSIVSGGVLIEVPPKGKAPRRALCLTDGHFQIVETVDRESYHDFAQALVDMGIKEALAIVGGESLIKYTTSDGRTHVDGHAFATKMKTENYLIWKK